MKKRRSNIPNDILPQQIVEDELGVMHVIPIEQLMNDGDGRAEPLAENELGVENMENDLPCADVEAYGSAGFESLEEFREEME